MYEYTIYNKALHEFNYIYGHSFSDALTLNPRINPEEWEYIAMNYID